MKILFICKMNEIYGWHSYARRSSGLYNSTQFIIQGLRKRGINARIVEVKDNNCIDREVSHFQPDVVIIEAFWVVPEKFDMLKKLHPKVKWFVHLHSGIPFLALEGIAVEWARGCVKRGVELIANSPESFRALKVVTPEGLHFLPNVYIQNPKRMKIHTEKHYVDVGCFGAVRPLKNQLIQALAAIQFAREIGKPLRFHLNHSRVETMGHPVLKNITKLFEGEKDAQLVMLPWLDPSDFLHHLEHHIDVSLQMSLSETFNVVTADAVSAGVPVVVSKEVKWVSCWNKADDDDIDSIIEAMHLVWHREMLVRWNQRLLRKFSEQAQEMWFDFCLGQEF